MASRLEVLRLARAGPDSVEMGQVVRALRAAAAALRSGVRRSRHEPRPRLRLRPVSAMGAGG